MSKTIDDYLICWHLQKAYSHSQIRLLFSSVYLECKVVLVHSVEAARDASQTIYKTVIFLEETVCVLHAHLRIARVLFRDGDMVIDVLKFLILLVLLLTLNYYVMSYSKTSIMFLQHSLHILLKFFVFFSHHIFISQSDRVGQGGILKFW